MFNKLKQIAAAALFAAAVMATTVQAQEIQAMAPEAVASVNGPGVIYVKFGGPGMETALENAPEGRGEICEGPGSAASGQMTEYGAVQGWTEEDLYVLAHVICGEAQNCPDDEQRYIGSVVLNRRNSGRYPGTIKGVVFQPGQYSCTRDGNYYRTPRPTGLTPGGCWRTAACCPGTWCSSRVDGRERAFICGRGIIIIVIKWGAMGGLRHAAGRLGGLRRARRSCTATLCLWASRRPI